MLRVDKRWQKKAYTYSRDGLFVDSRGRRIPREKIERSYIPIGDYVADVLGIKDPASHYTTVQLIWDYINQRGKQGDFICVEIEKSQRGNHQAIFGFWVRKDWRPDFLLFKEAV